MNQSQNGSQAALALVQACLGESIRIQQVLLESCGRAIARAGEETARVLRAGGRVLLFGNGGSAADAQHIAAEWVGRYVRDRQPLSAIALSANASELTAIGNDFGFDQIFARGIQAHGRAGDLAIALSTSGRSPNVLAAVSVAGERGLFTVGLTGQDGGPLAERVDLAIRVPSTETPRIQESHIAICHAICEVVEEGFRV